MKVRLAQLADVSNILAFAKARIGGTNYEGFPFNSVIARRTLIASMKDPASRVWVVESGERIRGFLIGEIAAMPFTHFSSATDLVFMADGGGDLLLEAFVAWCKLRKVARIDMGVSASQQTEAMDRLYERAGFSQAGRVYYINWLPAEAKGAAA